MGCDGCIWYRADGIKVRCLNVTMVNRGAWHPIPQDRCKEYSDGLERKTNVKHKKAARAIPGDR